MLHHLFICELLNLNFLIPAHVLGGFFRIRFLDYKHLSFTIKDDKNNFIILKWKIGTLALRSLQTWLQRALHLIYRDVRCHSDHNSLHMTNCWCFRMLRLFYLTLLLNMFCQDVFSYKFLFTEFYTKHWALKSYFKIYLGKFSPLMLLFL